MRCLSSCVLRCLLCFAVRGLLLSVVRCEVFVTRGVKLNGCNMMCVCCMVVVACCIWCVVVRRVLLDVCRLLFVGS